MDSSNFSDSSSFTHFDCGEAGRLWTWIVGTCIAFSYIVSLYIHPGGEKFFAFPMRERNDPGEIISRFRRVFYASIFSLIISVGFQLFHHSSPKEETSIWDIFTNLGFRTDGILNAVVIPVFLTLILFFGPLIGDYICGRFNGYNRAFISLLYNNLHYRKRFLRDSIYSLMWQRAFIVAPLSEEFVYRACLVPVIIPCFGRTAAIFISPFSFGVAHLHHIFDRIRLGSSMVDALTTTLLQIGYTSLFGAYSAYLFVKTGHFIAPVIVHAFCNSLGVPDVSAHLNSRWKGIIVGAYFLGLFMWMAVLNSLTDPVLYGLKS